MREFVFPAYVSFGKMDNAETEVRITLTDEEAAMLEEAAKKDPEGGIAEHRELGTLADRIYDAANAQITKELLESDRDYRTEYCRDDDPEWMADWDYGIGVGFPEEIAEKYRYDEEEYDEEDE